MAVNLSPTDYNYRVCTSSTRPSVPSEGMMIYETDTDLSYKYDGSTWVRFGGGKVLQVVNTQTGAVVTGTTMIPGDDTIPQNTEGDQYMTLAITPLSASSYLLIEVVVFGNHNNGGGALGLGAALFVDSTASALAATYGITGGSGWPTILSFNHYVASGSTSARTYKVRAGVLSAGYTFTINGSNGGRIFGGVLSSSITITEIAS